MVFLAMGMSIENYEEKRKTDRRKTLKKEVREKRRLRGKSNNNNILLENIIWRKIVYAINNDTPKLDIHKYKNYDIIEICINRQSTTT